MPSPELFKRFVLATTITILALSLVAGVFFVGLRVGRERALHRVNEAITGERSVEELERLGTGRADAPAKYTARGTVVANGSGDFTVEDLKGTRSEIVVTPETSIRMNGVIIPKKEVQEGDTIFVLGQPSGQNAMRAKMVRVLSQPE
jgi:hypothetical protein